MNSKPRIRVSDGWPKEITCAGSSVKVYARTKNRQYRVFEVTDFSSGTRQLRSFSDEAAAIDEAKRLVALMAEGEAHAASLRGPDRATFSRALSLIKDSGVSLETACALFADATRILGSPQLLLEAARHYADSKKSIQNIRFSDAVVQYIDAKRTQGASDRYLQDLQYRLGKAAHAFQTDVAEIGSCHVQVWIDALKLSAQSARNYRTVLNGFFEFALARSWCGTNPAQSIVVSQIKSAEEPEIFSPWEFAALLRSASKEFLPCLVLGGFCGLRSAEIERLHWEDIHLDTAEIVIRRGTAKTRSRRIVPLCPSAVEWLAPYRAAAGPVWAGTHEQFYDAQTKTASAAEVPWRANALRHSYASYRMALVGDAVRVAHELGNSPTVVHAFYKSLVSPPQGKEWFDVSAAR